VGSLYDPPHPHEDVCTDRQIDLYFECVYGNSASCIAMNADAGSACRECIDFGSPASGYAGPLVTLATSGGSVNSAGCGALVNGDTTATGCGKALADQEGCFDVTCLDECPNDYAGCVKQSAATQCKSFVVAAKAACPVDASECYVRSTDANSEAVIKRVFKRFCGIP
jgi:hypothetical protein